MRFLKLAALAVAAAIGLAAGGPVSAQKAIPKLTPASPQPNPAALKQGLAVRYAYPSAVRTLDQARSMAPNGRPGPPLVGFDYPNTVGGENALTSERATFVVAKITGYIKFDEPGIYEMEYQSNDGLDVTMGGEKIYEFDYRTPCSGYGAFKVEVPSAGYYDVSAVFFQRYKTSCLLMKLRKPSQSALDWAPNDIFFYKP